MKTEYPFSLEAILINSRKQVWDVIVSCWCCWFPCASTPEIPMIGQAPGMPVLCRNRKCQLADGQALCLVPESGYWTRERE